MINKDLIKITDVIAIIKLRDIYEHLEIATDNCEDVSTALSHNATISTTSKNPVVKVNSCNPGAGLQSRSVSTSNGLWVMLIDARTLFSYMLSFWKKTCVRYGEMFLTSPIKQSADPRILFREAQVSGYFGRKSSSGMGFNRSRSLSCPRMNVTMMISGIDAIKNDQNAP